MAPPPLCRLTKAAALRLVCRILEPEAAGRRGAAAIKMPRKRRRGDIPDGERRALNNPFRACGFPPFFLHKHVGRARAHTHTQTPVHARARTHAHTLTHKQD